MADKVKLSKKDEIIKLIQAHGIKPGYLSDTLNIPVKTLLLILEGDNSLDENLYNKLKDAVDAYQLDFGLFGTSDKPTATLFDDREFQIGIGERIRVFAKKKYKTLKKLADSMEISPQQLQQYISGKREPGTRILSKLLKLGCDLNWLLGGSERDENYRESTLENENRRLKEKLDEIKRLAE